MGLGQTHSKATNACKWSNDKHCQTQVEWRWSSSETKVHLRSFCRSCSQTFIQMNSIQTQARQKWVFLFHKEYSSVMGGGFSPSPVEDYTTDQLYLCWILISIFKKVLLYMKNLFLTGKRRLFQWMIFCKNLLYHFL